MELVKKFKTSFKKLQSNQRSKSQTLKQNEAQSNKTSFDSFGFSSEIERAIKDVGYSSPTAIQASSIEPILDGKDIMGCAQTGTGKTAAFALPILQNLAKGSKKDSTKIRCLVLTPTRELALQVSNSFKSYGQHLPLKSCVVFGGVGIEPQKKTLRKGVDILVATPGRLLDLRNQGCVKLNEVEMFVLDEADRMLDMGFLNDVKRIIGSLPRKRQNIMYSATMPKDIEELSKNILVNPVKVEVARVSSANDSVQQYVYHVNRVNKRHLLMHVLEDPRTYKVLVFTRTKAIANRVTKHLNSKSISAEAIHGNKSQSARQRALENFRGEKTRVLVASDLAARGLDVVDITHVVNYDIPNVAETYVHRIGRTGRGLAEGVSLSFCDNEERPYIRSIERLTRKRIDEVTDHPFPFDVEAIIPAENNSGPRRQPRPRHGSQRPGRSGSAKRSGVSSKRSSSHQK